MVLALVSHNTLREYGNMLNVRMVLALVSHNTLIEKLWKYVECLNGISIGISQYTHRENMEIC